MRSWVEHTGELELELAAGSVTALFEEGAIALGELLAERGEARDRNAGAEQLEVSVTAPDRATLLAEWLSELAYHAERDGAVPERVERLELSETALDALVAVVRQEVPHLVKAVTYHRLGIWREDETWCARVVLDV